jgi:hypothetical protein
MDNKAPEKLLMTSSRSCSFIFESDTLSTQQEERILENWPLVQDHHLVNERVIQNYLTECGYEIDVIVYPFSLLTWPFPSTIGQKKAFPEYGLSGSDTKMADGSERVGPGRSVCFCLQRENGAKSDLRHYVDQTKIWLTEMGPGIQGYVIINIWEIYITVKDILDRLGLKEDSSLSIKEISENFWPWANKNLKGTIHNWMQGIPYKDRPRIPVFKPETAVKKADSAGSRLSLSDIITVALLTGLFSHGVRSYDFEGPTEFKVATPEEIRQYVNAMLTEPLPGVGFSIEKRVVK